MEDLRTIVYLLFGKFIKIKYNVTIDITERIGHYEHHYFWKRQYGKGHCSQF